MFGNRGFGNQYWAQSSLLRRIIPPVIRRGIGGSGFPPDQIKRLLDQLALRGPESLDDDEVVALMMLGYL